MRAGHVAVVLSVLAVILAMSALVIVILDGWGLN